MFKKNDIRRRAWVISGRVSGRPKYSFHLCIYNAFGKG